MPMTPEQMWSKIIANLPAKTGKSLPEWIEIVRAKGLTKRAEKIAWLKQEFGVGHGQAQVIVDEADKPADFVAQTPAEWLEAQYAGSKAGLRPIYERLAEAARTLGSDVELAPRQTYVSLIRRRQFGIIQPSANRRVDLGLVLPGAEPTHRLQPAGSFGSGRTTHRVGLTSPDEVDDELRGWLRAAYEADV